MAVEGGPRVPKKQCLAPEVEAAAAVQRCATSAEAAAAAPSSSERCSKTDSD